MMGASNMLELCRIPSNRFLFGTSKLIKGSRQIPNRSFYPIMCLCKEIQTTTAEKIMGASYIPDTKFKKETKLKVNEPVVIEGVGAFQKLPMVMPSVDIIQSAIRKAKKVSATKGIANIAKRERNRGAKQLDALMKELAVPLRLYTESFPNKNHLHPYERSLIELTLGDGNYEEVLSKVNNLRKKVTAVAKEHASVCAKSLTKKEAEERLNEGMKRVEAAYYRESKAVDDLLNIAKICNYPFTTRGILMGHIVVNYQRFQVTDTPGVLTRLDEERNNLEKLTLAVLTHLPTAVIYVHDLTGECGTSVSDQFTTYTEIRGRFSKHLWIDVVSKCDILHESPSAFITEDLTTDDADLARYRIFGPEGAMRVSVMNGHGLDELKEKVHNMLISQSEKIRRQIIDPKCDATPT
ncbi:nucleolar GTP-binding protein 1 isoform X2 [Spinacia oleracea]|uniref:Nucleolar GTP-binding protein 1 isoform X2 n=1 Tax=Spinacia oleracea TaxID=3562 RepID=A0A9R0JF27_SPIOL|nr:nucleolar GTP-binding protein 1 isoform X2 [Spinacia oleracea]